MNYSRVLAVPLSPVTPGVNTTTPVLRPLINAEPIKYGHIILVSQQWAWLIKYTNQQKLALCTKCNQSDINFIRNQIKTHKKEGRPQRKTNPHYRPIQTNDVVCTNVDIVTYTPNGCGISTKAQLTSNSTSTIIHAKICNRVKKDT